MNLHLSIVHFYHFVREKIIDSFLTIQFKPINKENSYRIVKKTEEKKDPNTQNGQILSTF